MTVLAQSATGKSKRTISEYGLDGNPIRPPYAGKLLTSKASC